MSKRRSETVGGRVVAGRRVTPRVGRRNFIKLAAAGSGLLGWPMLNSLTLRAQEVMPLRLLLVFSPNGTIQDEFWPVAGETESDFSLGRITKPFEPFKDRLLFLKGLSILVRDLGPGGPHQKGVGGLFTNNQLQEGEFVDGDGSRSGWADGISVDQEISRHIGQQSYLPSLELGVRAMEPEVRGRISYAGPGNPMPPVNSPLAAYERLFAGFSDVDESLRGTRMSVMDTVQQQYAALGSRLSAVDRVKLEQHADLIRGIERRMNIAVDTSVCQQPELPPDIEADSESTMPEVSRLHRQLLTAAFSCGLTRIASLQFSTAVNDIRMPWVESTGSGHALSHAGDSNDDATEERIRRQNWMAQELADLMADLDAIPEGGGTVLDNTLIVWANELGVGNAHTHSNIPFLLAGGANSMLRMGRFVQYPDDTNHGALLVALLNAMGVDADGFGHPDYAVGPLSNLT